MSQELTAITSLAPRPASGSFVLPAIIAAAGEKASKRFFEFFTVNIRNLNTRQAYFRAVQNFMSWCERKGLCLEQIEPMMVAAYIEKLPISASSIKQNLAAIRMLFD